MDEKIVQSYDYLLGHLKNIIDQHFKDKLFNEFPRIETFDSKWKIVVNNITNFLNQVISKEGHLREYILYSGYFTHDDAATILLDLLWQDTHGDKQIKDTIFYYKTYKVQLSDKNLLTDKTN